VNLFTSRVPSPLGAIRLSVRDDGALVELEFGSPSGGEAIERAAEALHARPFVAAAAAVEDYFRGGRGLFELPVATAGTEFQERVWAELRLVPYGRTISYGELARRIGNPRAVRAAARANARNPIAIRIPCHRVIGADGSLTGYAAGTDRKRALLELEGALLPLAGARPSISK
jgi:methylated-DNA-[protein]-cysteine S-methyltransferase